MNVSSFSPPASCLLRLADGSVLAADAQLTAWLGSDAAHCDRSSLQKLLPDLDKLLAAHAQSGGPPLSTETPMVQEDGTTQLTTIDVT
ncbi:MAG: hypothetical protein MI725_14450, partial [Pirellulales bacterium]|nr:hypothetical protein [Pirellulales bacterium]